ncbi:MAG: hypothetical protein ABW210_10220 [Achromobacter sp.]
MAPVPANPAACSGMPAAVAATSIRAYTVAPALDRLTAKPDAAPRPPGVVGRLWRRIIAAFAPRPYGAWTEAMTELRHLDGDTLRDVGAPPWLMHQIEIQRERDARSLRMLHHR